MASAKIFRINYKSDFILTLVSDAGWMTPFCIKFWTGAPSQAYYVGWDGETYDHCSFDPSEPTKLQVQFDDHHLPIGELKYQVAYHFTVADFPNDTEDEVINPANITTEIDGETYHVMLDFTGETAPEIEFSLPAYANEAQRIANEQQRIAAETQRIANEETRIANEQIRINQEQTRQQNEQQRINQEQGRVNEYASLKADAVAATDAANDAATLANQKAQLAADKAALAQSAANLANAKAQLAADKAALAASAAQLANNKAALAQQRAEYAQTQGGYAKDKGDYAKAQGDYAKAQGDTALADHQRAEADHGIAVDDHTQAGNDHTRAESDHGIAVDDHTQAGNDHTRAESDHGIAADDHTRAESDHAAVELYVDSLGVFDLSKHNAVGGVLATYADLSAALTALNALDSQYKYGGMSLKFVQTYDIIYVKFFCTAQNFTTDVTQWQGVDDVPTAGSNNLVKSGGIKGQLDEKVDIKIGDNLINPNNIIDGYYLNEYGTPLPNETYSVSGFIPVDAGSAYSKGIEMTSSFRYVNFFDANKQHLNGTRIEYGSTFEVIQNAAFVRVTFYTTQKQYAQLTKTPTQMNFVDFTPISGYMVDNIKPSSVGTSALKPGCATEEKLDPTLLKRIGFFENKNTDNLLNPQIVQSGYWNGGHNDSTTYCYGYIDIQNLTAGTKLKAINSLGTVLTMRFCQFYRGTTSVSVLQNVDVAEIPSNVDKVYTTFTASTVPQGNYENIGVFNSETPSWSYYLKYTAAKWEKQPTDPYALARIIDITAKSNLNGKKWVACGDSFTEGDFTGYIDGEGHTGTESDAYDQDAGMYKTYPWWIMKRTGCILINEAISGSCLANPQDGSTNYFSNTRYQNIPADVDYITIKLGINDSHKEIPIGTIDDNVNTTFYGAWNIVLSWLLVNRPNAKIGLIATNGAGSVDYSNATQAIAEKYGVLCLNEATGDDVPWFFRQDFKPCPAAVVNAKMAIFRVTETNWHPNVKCAEYESTIVEAFLNRL